MSRLKISLLIISGIFAFLLLAFLLLHAWLPGFLSAKIGSELTTRMNTNSPGLYEVEVGAISFSSIFKSTSLSEIRVKFNSNNQIDTDSTQWPPHIFEFEGYGLNFSSWGLITLALGRKRVDMNHLSTDSIFLFMYSNEFGVKQEDSRQARNLEQLHLKNISTNKLRFERRTLRDSLRQVYETGLVNFNGSVVFHSSNSDHAQNPEIIAHSLKVLDVRSSSTNGLYTFHVDSIFVNNNEQSAEMNGFSVVPVYNKQDFQKHVSYVTNWYDARIEQIKVEGLQQDRMNQDGSLVLSQIKINGGKVAIFRDRNLPFDASRRPVMPVKLIQDATFGLHIGEVQLNHIDIIYNELIEDADSSGEVTFMQLSGTIKNISNWEDSLALDSIMSIKAEAMIFGKAKLQAEFDYQLSDPYGAFKAKGNLAALSFVHVNPALYPLAGVKVIDGKHHHTSFFFYGNDVRSVGEIRMQYSGLEIELIPDGKKIFKGIARFAGKNLIYNHENLKDKGNLRVGKIAYDRDTTRFVFHYWGHTFLSGVKDAVMKDYF